MVSSHSRWSGSTPAGRSKAAVAGTVVVRLLQGLVFGAILHWGRRDDTPGGHGWLLSSVVLVVGVVLLTTAIREILGGGDPEVSGRVHQAIMGMHRLNIAELEAAASA